MCKLHYPSTPVAPSRRCVGSSCNAQPHTVKISGLINHTPSSGGHLGILAELIKLPSQVLHDSKHHISPSGPYEKKQFTMEPDSKERKQRNCNTFLTTFVAVTFTVALLQGAGIVIFYTHFQNANTALEARVTVLEETILALNQKSSTDGGKPAHDNELRSSRNGQSSILSVLFHLCS